MKEISEFSEEVGLKQDLTKLGEFIQMIYRVFHLKH